MGLKRPLAEGDEAAERTGGNRWASSIEVRQLRVLLALVEHGSVSGAAEALGLAQSTVSEALAALDRAVGTPTVLRKRGAHRIGLTPAGETLVPHARAVLLQLDEARLAIATVTRQAGATVKVMANESVSTYLLPSALGVLRHRWPNTQFSVSIGTCAAVRAGVASGHCDVGLLLEEAGSDGVAANVSPDASRLVLNGRIPLVVFASPAHPLSLRTTSSPIPRDALAPFPMFVSDAAGDFYELLRRYFQEGGLPGPRLVSAGSIEGVKRGVAGDETALGILPLYAVAEDLRSGPWRGLTLAPMSPGMRLVALLAPALGSRHPATTELVAQLMP